MKSVRRRDADGFDVGHLDQQQACVDHPVAQSRQNRRRILHMLERVIHRHDVEAAGRECRILHEASRDRNAERLARMARVLFVGFETATRRSRASAARRPLRRRRRRRREYDRRALYKVRARDSDSARRGPTWRYGASTAWSAPCSRAGIRSNSSAALLLPRPRIRPHEAAFAANRRAQRVPVAIAIADHLDIGRAAEVAGDRALNHDWRPARIAAAPTRRENSSASGRTSADARARTSRPEGDP